MFRLTKSHPRSALVPGNGKRAENKSTDVGDYQTGLMLDCVYIEKGVRIQHEFQFSEKLHLLFHTKESGTGQIEENYMSQLGEIDPPQLT